MSDNLSDLYINIWDYKDKRYPFQIFIGARGCGKTYSALKGAKDGEIEANSKFIYMRRTDREIEILQDGENGEGANPFKKINSNDGCNIGFKKIIHNVSGIYNRDENKTPVGAPIGYGLALSTIASIRSVDFTDCSDCFFDEFIKEKHVKAIKEEGTAFLNAYETLNRNRELEGFPALRMWLLANSNDIYTPIFEVLGIVDVIEKMRRNGKAHKYLPERGLAIHLLNDNGVYTEQKSKTALYKLTKGTQFYEMALNNNFAYNDFSLIGYRNITGYQPVCALDNAYIYRKKGDEEYYISYAPARCIVYNSKTEQELRRFQQEIGIGLTPYFIAGKITFESFDLKCHLLDVIL